MLVRVQSTGIATNFVMKASMLKHAACSQDAEKAHASVYYSVPASAHWVSDNLKVNDNAAQTARFLPGRLKRLPAPELLLLVGPDSMMMLSSMFSA